MIIKFSSLKIVAAIGLIVTGFQIQLEFDSCNRFQQLRGDQRQGQPPPALRHPPLLRP